METYIPKLNEINQKWLVVDADGQILGRLASEVASILRGKNKPIFTPHMDVGDHVIIINAGKIRVTGKKAKTKKYYRHTGYPGGLRSDSYSDLIKSNPAKILEKAIWGMLPHNKLGKKIYKKLKIYAGNEHPHEAQKPEKIEIG
ncbi:50S ribosomal protein L13 [candidate division KSB1 bacterium]|nr:50S ribosomal protein L13 [candidate division KSB1 bacterium]MCH8018678.1 50S ribosomal protein L13 [candidate division KSB1 bacterium]MCH8871505.1 50S ribosomal protein L13 [candidate division KSB1 bacterium]MCH8955161.1 50S ribosomal protein L13 [candidate division KSB1 bacterium]MCH8981751.1 50S ribosomal protein L13 [candidate division KSB1 bacterium]